MDSIGMGGTLTKSNMNLMKKQLDGSEVINESIGYTYIECRYLVSILKNRSVQASSIKE